MQIPPIDRTPNQRPSSADAASIVAARVNPVAQANQTVHAAAPASTPAPTPSVINMVNMVNVENAVNAAHSMFAEPSASAARVANAADAVRPAQALDNLNAVNPLNAPTAPGASNPANALSASDSTYTVNKPNAANSANKSNAGEGAYTSVSDPARRGSEAATGQKDWTVRRPKPEKVEDPPPVPMSKILMDHVKHMWEAGASAIQVQQVQNLQDPVQQNKNQNPNATPGVLTKEVFTYAPNKIKKPENI